MLSLLLPLALGAPPSHGPDEHATLPPGIEVPCGTPEQWGINDIAPVRPSVPPPPAGKGVRDAWEETPNELLGERFVIKWGDSGNVDRAALERLLSHFEVSWDVEIDDMEHEAPYGTDEWLFNVYIGNSGGKVPKIQGAAAYYSRDAQGWPMIVVSPDTLRDDQFAKITAAHEFYHAVQGASDRYNYQPYGPSAWFWESTATWASSLVFPDNPRYTVFLFGYAFNPHMPVNFFDYPDSGAVIEYYQYGAFIFPVAISDETGSWEAIANTWKDEGSSGDPLEVLRVRLKEDGHDLDAMWMRHNARNATWDYRHGEYMKSSLIQMSQYPGYSNMVAGSIPKDGMAEPKRNPPALAPLRYGYNTYQLNWPADGDLLVTVDGDATGSAGSPGRYGAQIVRDFGGGRLEYVEVPFDGMHGELELEDVGEEQSIFLVVGAWTPFLPTQWRTETFGYSYQAQLILPPEPELPEPEDEVSSCGCDGSTGPVGGLVLLPLGLVLLARRRRS